MLDVQRLLLSVGETDGMIWLHYGAIGVEVANLFDEFLLFKKLLVAELKKIENEMRDYHFPNKVERSET